ncbi:MAG: L,D-transpeptidase family protein [Candidatus Nanopelagicales bacterium]
MHLSTRRKSVRLVASVASIATVGVVMVGAPVFADEVPTEEPTSTPSAPPVEPCLTSVPKVRKKYWSKVPTGTKQVVLVEGRSMKSYSSKVVRWEKRGKCWFKLSTFDAYNGYRGWAIVPWTGGQRSPIGTYRLTDAGGRLANPGTKMRYHYGPQAYGAGGYAMSRAKLQIFDYVVAVNYNRKAGTTPRANKVLTRKKASGYWFHVRRAFPTRGCVSMSRPNMKTFTRWLDPSKKPVTIQGPRTTIYS